MRTIIACAGAVALLASVAAADDCKFCATEVVVPARQLACLKQRVEQAVREIGDKNTALIDLLSCGTPSGGAPQSGVSPQAPPPVAGAAPASGPVQVYRLTKAGLACIQQRLANPPPGDPVRLSAICP